MIQKKLSSKKTLIAIFSICIFAFGVLVLTIDQYNKYNNSPEMKAYITEQRQIEENRIKERDKNLKPKFCKDYKEQYLELKAKIEGNDKFLQKMELRISQGNLTEAEEKVNGWVTPLSSQISSLNQTIVKDKADLVVLEIRVKEYCN